MKFLRQQLGILFVSRWPNPTNITVIYENDVHSLCIVSGWHDAPLAFAQSLPPVLPLAFVQLEYLLQLPQLHVEPAQHKLHGISIFLMWFIS